MFQAQRERGRSTDSYAQWSRPCLYGGWTRDRHQSDCGYVAGHDDRGQFHTHCSQSRGEFHCTDGHAARGWNPSGISPSGDHAVALSDLRVQLAQRVQQARWLAREFMDGSNCMKQRSAVTLPQRRRLAIAISLLFAGTTGAAHAADVQINTPPSGSFVVKDNAGANTLLKVDGSGPVTVPNLLTAPIYTIGVCFGPNGELGRCASIAGPTGATGATGRGCNRGHRSRGCNRGNRFRGCNRGNRSRGCNWSYRSSGGDRRYRSRGCNRRHGCDGRYRTHGCNGRHRCYGATGATGGGLSAYAYIYNLEAQVVAIEADVAFDTTGPLLGITHAPGTSVITIVNSGTYEIRCRCRGSSRISSRCS